MAPRRKNTNALKKSAESKSTKEPKKEEVQEELCPDESEEEQEDSVEDSSSSSDEEEVDEEEPEYSVAKILKKRVNHYEEEYLIQWHGYTEKTWEPKQNLTNCQKLLKEFNENLKAQNEKEKDAVKLGKRKLPGRQSVSKNIKKK